MIADREPEFPVAPEGVLSWLHERFGYETRIDALRDLRGDLPRDVEAFLVTWEDWLVHREEWRAKQPLDRELDRDAFRMFGGDWLGADLVVFGEEERLFALGGAGDLIAAGATEEELRRFAGALYEYQRVSARLADEVLAVRNDILRKEKSG